MVEFVLCFSLIWLPLFFGTAVIGFDLIRAMQVTQLCRDAGHMYSAGTDFSQPGAQTLLVSLAGTIDLSSSGNGAVILSTVTYVTDADCENANLQSNCPNKNNYVFTRQVVVGNSTGLNFASAFGTPSTGIKDSSGSIAAAYYLTDPTAVANNFYSQTGISMQSSIQSSYVSESMARALQPISWKNFSNPTASARFFF